MHFGGIKMSASEGSTKTPKGTLNGLRLRYEKFVEAFVSNGGNATKAAQFAGYDQTPASLRARGSRTLENPQVQARMKSRLRHGATLRTDELMRVLANRYDGDSGAAGG